MTATEGYFLVVLFIMLFMVILTSESLDETLGVLWEHKMRGKGEGLHWTPFSPPSFSPFLSSFPSARQVFSFLLYCSPFVTILHNRKCVRYLYTGILWTYRVKAKISLAIYSPLRLSFFTSRFATAPRCTSSGPSARRRMRAHDQNWASGWSEERPAPPNA